MQRTSAKDALLARLNIVRKRMHWYTIAIVIWLAFWVIYLFLMSGINNVNVAENSQLVEWGQVPAFYPELESLFYTILYILWALAIVGIIVHYIRDKPSSRLRWGPLCGIAAAAVYLVGTVVSLYYNPFASSYVSGYSSPWQ
jgi:hypothetical protein